MCCSFIILTFDLTLLRLLRNSLRCLTPYMARSFYILSVVGKGVWNEKAAIGDCLSLSKILALVNKSPHCCDQQVARVETSP